MRGNSKPQHRHILRIELLPDAQERFTAIHDRLGITQVAIASRLVEWAAEQSDVLQAAILGLYPDDVRDQIVPLIFKHIASPKKK